MTWSYASSHTGADDETNEYRDNEQEQDEACDTQRDHRITGEGVLRRFVEAFFAPLVIHARYFSTSGQRTVPVSPIQAECFYECAFVMEMNRSRRGVLAVLRIPRGCLRIWALGRATP